MSAQSKVNILMAIMGRLLLKEDIRSANDRMLNKEIPALFINNYRLVE